MKKAIIITCVSLILVLLSTILFLALYQRNFAYDFTKPELVEVNGWTGEKIDSEKIYEELTGSSSQSILSSAFNQSQVKKPRITKNYSLRTFTGSLQYMITLRWNEEQTLMLNGEEYNDSSNYSKKYKEIRCEISNDCKDIMLKFYVMDLTETNKYIYTIEQYGDYTQLYEYLSSINF